MPTVKLYANLRTLAGMKELSIPGATVGAVLSGLMMRHPSLSNAIIDGEELRPHIVVMVNGHHVNDFTTPVDEEDNIAVFPPIAGG